MRSETNAIREDWRPKKFVTDWRLSLASAVLGACCYYFRGRWSEICTSKHPGIPCEPLLTGLSYISVSAFLGVMRFGFVAGFAPLDRLLRVMSVQIGFPLICFQYYIQSHQPPPDELNSSNIGMWLFCTFLFMYSFNIRFWDWVVADLSMVTVIYSTVVHWRLGVGTVLPLIMLVVSLILTPILYLGSYDLRANIITGSVGLFALLVATAMFPELSLTMMVPTFGAVLGMSAGPLFLTGRTTHLHFFLWTVCCSVCLLFMGLLRGLEPPEQTVNDVLAEFVGNSV
eukprot:64240_1